MQFRAILLLSFCALALSQKRVFQKQTYSIILFDDWDDRSNKSPPHVDNTDVTEEINGNERKYTFHAFNRDWKLDVKKNTILLGKSSNIDETDTRGNVLRSYSTSKYNNCFFIGTTESADNEVGFAAVTSCNGKLRAYVITNKNDYMLNLIVPKSSFRSMSAPVGVEDMYKAYMHSRDNNFIYNQLKRLRRNAQEALKNGKQSEDDPNNLKEFIQIKPMPRPHGRMVHVEAALFFDKAYKDDFMARMVNDAEEFRVHSMEVLNYAQLWFLHPTLGFRVWFTAKRIIHVNAGFPRANVQYPFDSICKWYKDNFKDSSGWDEVMMFTGDRKNCNGIGGVAMPSGACSKLVERRCFCLDQQNFHTGALIRTLVHEAAHPLGMPDDYRLPTAAICYTGMMRYGVFTDNDWAICSVQTIERFLHTQENNCVHHDQSPSVPSHPPMIPVDVAWRGKAEQSSTYINDKTWGAWKAVDGPIAGAPWDNRLSGNLTEFASCTHTTRENNPWLRVDLGAENQNQWIDAIDIYNREDCCSNRLRNFEVRVGNSMDISQNSLCKHYKGVVEGGKYGMVRIRCNGWLSGRYVSVQIKENNAILTVCQIFVFQHIAMKNFDHRPIKCFDQARWCDDWLRAGECRRQLGQSQCKRSCRLCTNHPNAPDLDPNAKSRPDAVTSKPSICKDGHSTCWHAAAMGWCKNKMSYCAASCDPKCTGRGVAPTSAPTRPTPPPDCKDDNKNCPDWARGGHCISAPHIKEYCRKSCKVC